MAGSDMSGLTARDVRVCVVYMFLASAMWVVNKKTITHLPVPFFVTLTQALATCAILKVAQHMKVIHMQPFSWETFGEEADDATARGGEREKNKPSARVPSPTPRHPPLLHTRHPGRWWYLPSPLVELCMKQTKTNSAL